MASVTAGIRLLQMTYETHENQLQELNKAGQ